MSFPYKAERCWYCRGKNQRCGECLHFDGYASAKDHAIAKLQDHITELEDAVGKVALELSTSKHFIWPGTAHRMARDVRAALRGEK